MPPHYKIKWHLLRFNRSPEQPYIELFLGDVAKVGEFRQFFKPLR